MKDWVFYTALACLCTHELDAMPSHEWRVLPLLRTLPDDVGMLTFVIGHVPLFAVIIALVASTVERTRTRVRVGISAFLVLHGLGHALTMGDPSYEFSSALSNALIFGGAAFGALYLLLDWRKSAGANN